MKKYIDALSSPHLQLDENISYESTIVEDIDKNLLFEKLYEIIETLNDREQLIVKLNYLNNIQQCKIAKEIGVSRGRVSEILNRALRKLRHPIYADPLRYMLNHMSKFDIEEEKAEKKAEKKRIVEEKKEKERIEAEKRRIEFEKKRFELDVFHRKYPILKTMPEYIKLELDSRGKRCIKINPRDWRNTNPQIAKSWLDQLIKIDDQKQST